MVWYRIWIYIVSYTINCLCICSAYFVQAKHENCMLQDANCALRVPRCELQVASCKLQTKNTRAEPQPRGQKAMHPNLHWQQCRRSSKQRYLIHTPRPTPAPAPAPTPTPTTTQTSQSHSRCQQAVPTYQPPLSHNNFTKINRLHLKTASYSQLSSARLGSARPGSAQLNSGRYDNFPAGTLL